MKIQKYIDNPTGVIEILGDFSDALLLLNGQPIQYTWFAEIGSTWRYHIAKGLTEKAIRENKEIEKLLEVEILNETTFYQIVNYFSQFLKSGVYEFGYYELTQELNWVEIPEKEDFNSFDYYGGGIDITPTQQITDDSIVLKYENDIKNGIKPTIIILRNKDSHIQFILDGHHKFLAYSRVGIPPNAIIITRIDTVSISLPNAEKILKTMNCTNDGYFEALKMEKRKKYFIMKLNLDKEYTPK